MGLRVLPGDYAIPKEADRLIKKMKEVYLKREDEVYLYLKPKIKDIEEDFLLVDPQKGVLIGEINNNDSENIEKEIQEKGNNHLIEKIFRFSNLLSSLYTSNSNLLDQNFQLKFNLHRKVFFTKINDFLLDSLEINNIKYEFIENNEIKKLDQNIIFSDISCELKTEDMAIIRSILFPELKIIQRNNLSKRGGGSKDLIKTLDLEQELAAKKYDIGHYLVSGVPGSGKTVILIARAIHLLRENPNWKILIMTYNRSLTQKLKNKLDELQEDARYFEINLGNIEVINFHRYALKIANTSVPKYAGDSFWSDELPNLALKNLEGKNPRYDAILIDEYQDFRNSWLKVCIASLKGHISEKHDNKEVKNLFLVGDRLQSIYNPVAINWSQDIGLSMSGRTKNLKTSYRSGKDHLDLALKYLQTDSNLSKEVEKFYEGSNGIEGINISQKNAIGFFEGGYDSIIDLLNTLIFKLGYKSEEILILTDNWNEANNFFKELPSNIQNKSEVAKEMRAEKLMITTYYSSKGIESPIVILLNVNSIKDKKLLYVGMTRASERLYLHDKSKASGNLNTLYTLSGGTL